MGKSGGNQKVKRTLANKVVSQARWRRVVRTELLRRDGPNCGYCGWDLTGNAEAHIDHIVPASQGGSDDLDNLALTCAFCNMAKQDYHVAAFMGWLAHIRSGHFICKARPLIANSMGGVDPMTFDKLRKCWWSNG